jgi:hypothetical protein
LGIFGAEDEVTRWLAGLPSEDFGRAQFYVDLLQREGPLLGEPYTRQLRGKLRELRSYLRRDQMRITYYVTKGRRIILLTVFRKTKQREATEVERAERVMLACVAEGHVAEEIDGQ